MEKKKSGQWNAHLGFEFTEYVGRVKGDERVPDDF